MSREALSRCCLAPTVLFLLLHALMPQRDAWSATPAPHEAGDRLARSVEFAIPAQEMTVALDLYSRASGMAILVDRQLAHGRRSTAVHGRLNARQALEQLLAGSGLAALYTGADAFTVKEAKLTRRADASSRNGGPAVREDNFARALQAALEQALCRSTVTRPGHYRAALQLWVGGSGEVRHSRLLASTGDARRDAAIIEGLSTLDIGRVPPSSLPQPVTVLVVPGAASAGTECNPWEGAVKP
ncbi:STN domain-containing protein [Pseudomonas sp. T1.Ur]|uniref:STN domain-containing protein n=1 Tax=Pseudomonas sp. T1.Ur TaxID=2928704 RepID=UPI00201E4788|nr:STN domain-containing protein [Pseudomonas sp. T1.Ur]MCL6701765.1 STN domain-containing protein [Pseudomonas sp. T1.Ur]